jgi:hypothetical protein
LQYSFTQIRSVTNSSRTSLVTDTSTAMISSNVWLRSGMSIAKPVLIPRRTALVNVETRWDAEA